MVLEEAVNEALPAVLRRGRRGERASRCSASPRSTSPTFDDGEQLTLHRRGRRPARVRAARLRRPRGHRRRRRGHRRRRRRAARRRCATASRTLTGVERAAADGDFVSIDLSATVDGEAVDDLTAKGLSYQVGQGSLLDGLDEAVTGLAAGESDGRSRPRWSAATTPARRRRSPSPSSPSRSASCRELDDDFAQTASEFDTLDELRDRPADPARRG